MNDNFEDLIKTNDGYRKKKVLILQLYKRWSVVVLWTEKHKVLWKRMETNFNGLVGISKQNVKKFLTHNESKKLLISFLIFSTNL